MKLIKKGKVSGFITYEDLANQLKGLELGFINIGFVALYSIIIILPPPKKSRKKEAFQFRFAKLPQKPEFRSSSRASAAPAHSNEYARKGAAAERNGSFPQTRD